MTSEGCDFCQEGRILKLEISASLTLDVIS